MLRMEFSFEKNNCQFFNTAVYFPQLYTIKYLIKDLSEY
jgi:hypothetical protein